MQSNQTAKQTAHAEAVREMFAGIAGSYDLLNHLLSLNIDKRWRRLVADDLREVLDRENAVVLDVACGTGDLTIELKRNSAATVMGTDFCRPMLMVAKGKRNTASGDLQYLESDAMHLPFADSTFDALTIAFGLRNLSDVEAGLAELYRVIKPAGRLVVLEFSSPVVPGFRQVFEFYFARVLPGIGGVISGSRGAYEYLPDSVSKFPNQKALADLMRSAGFTNVSYTNLTGGIAALHSGSKS